MTLAGLTAAQRQCEIKCPVALFKLEKAAGSHTQICCPVLVSARTAHSQTISLEMLFAKIVFGWFAHHASIWSRSFFLQFQPHGDIMDPNVTA